MPLEKRYLHTQVEADFARYPRRNGLDVPANARVDECTMILLLTLACIVSDPDKSDSAESGDETDTDSGDTGRSDDTAGETGADDSGVGDTAIDDSGDADTDETGGPNELEPGGRWSGDERLPGSGYALNGDRHGDSVGTALAIGDVDGDGHDDIVTGTPFSNRGDDYSGVAWMMRGPFSESVSFVDADAIFAGNEGTYAAVGIEIINDYDGDGAGEVAISASCSDIESYANCPSEIYVFKQFTGDLDPSQADGVWTSPGDEEDGAGVAMLGTGDFSGDGTTDLVVGARFWDRKGAVYLLDVLADGSDSLDAADAVIYASETEDSSSFGSSMADLGDLDGDGANDLAIGWGAYSDDEYYAGGAVVFLGPILSSRDASDHDGVVQGEDYGQFLGSLPDTLAAAGDVDGDGTPDVLVSAPDWGDGGYNHGVVYLISGAEFLAGTKALYAEAKITDGSDQDRMGSAVHGPGDLDGDGKSEVLVGKRGDSTYADQGGAAGLFYGPVHGNLEFADAEARWYGGTNVGNLGRTVGSGEMTGDSYLDLVFGEPSGEGDSDASGVIYVVPGFAP